MKEITENELINLIRERHPRCILESKEVVLNDVVGEFLKYTVKEIKVKNDDEIEKIFVFVEVLMCTGNQALLDAVAICFLEELLNKDPHEIQVVNFSKHLGKRSIAYLRAWSDFQGKQTEGL